MKKWVLWAVVLVLLIPIFCFGIYYLYETQKCSGENTSNCNLKCKIDSDCKRDSCSCINKNEEMSNCIFGNCALADCFNSGCACIEGKCESFSAYDIMNGFSVKSVSCTRNNGDTNMNVNLNYVNPLHSHVISNFSFVLNGARVATLPYSLDGNYRIELPSKSFPGPAQNLKVAAWLNGNELGGFQETEFTCS